MLATQQLTLALPGRLLRVPDVQFAPGQCWALLGRNGTGKSSLLQTLATRSLAASGEMTLFGRPVAAWSRRTRAQLMGFLPQSIEMGCSTRVADYVALATYPYTAFGWGADAYILQRVDSALQRFGLSELSSALTHQLSGGERQRVALAALAVQQPRVCLLDEPLAHLDLVFQQVVMRWLLTLSQAGHSLVLTLHDLNWALRYCSHALLIDIYGHAIAGPVETMLQPDYLSECYGQDIRWVDAGDRVLTALESPAQRGS